MDNNDKILYYKMSNQAALWFLKTNKLSGLFNDFELAKQYLDAYLSYEAQKIISKNGNINGCEFIFETSTTINKKEVREIVKAEMKKIPHSFAINEITEAYYDKNRGIYFVYDDSFEFYELFLNENNAIDFINRKIKDLGDIEMKIDDPNNFFKIYNFFGKNGKNGKKGRIIRAKFVDESDL